MKKLMVSILIILTAAIMQSGCSGGEIRSISLVSNTISTILSNNMDTSIDSSATSVESVMTSSVTRQEASNITGNVSNGIDIDLTSMSTTMIYSQVYLILTQPTDYIGKTIKIKGKYYASYFQDTCKYYHYIVVSDVTACCTQGIEFIWNGEHTYPADYPIDSTEVVIQGTFSQYEELGVTYTYIATDDILRM